jgi:hypothetical protein
LGGAGREGAVVAEVVGREKAQGVGREGEEETRKGDSIA